jgi:hypothetical protein
VPAGLWLYRAEDIGGPAAFVFVVPARFPSWRYRRGWPHIGMQGDPLLIQTDYRSLGSLVGFEDVFHLDDVVVIQVGYHPHFFPATA